MQRSRKLSFTPRFRPGPGGNGSYPQLLRAKKKRGVLGFPAPLGFLTAPLGSPTAPLGVQYHACWVPERARGGGDEYHQCSKGGGRAVKKRGGFYGSRTTKTLGS
eukprot:gene17096-biopygen783